MQTWQRKHITKNKPKLLELTMCHQQLLCELEAVKVLSKADIAKIKSKANEHEQTSCLYDIVETRTNGYIELLKALSKGQQDEAANLLIKGLPTNSFSQLQVRFLGHDRYLSDLFNDQDIIEFKEKIKFLDLNKYITLSSNCTSEVIPLLRDTIPKPEEFYVPRQLTRCTTVDTQLFTAECQDVFVFNNVTRAQLSQLAKTAKCHTDTSTRQILNLNARFILLDDDNHWKSICDIARGIPVHLFTFDSVTKAYQLTKTTGGSRIINNYLNNKFKTANFVVEEDQVITLEKDEGLCISDLPGMGKSLLLANLARTFSKGNPETITAFIPLPTVSTFIKTNVITGLDEFPLAMEVLAQLLAPNEISGQILLLLLKKQKYPVHVYFDGLDEVSDVHLPHVKLFLNTLKNEGKWIRIHVTARTHMRHELEAALGVIPYDIVPFTHENKIQFLINFWRNRDSSCDEKKLAEFASSCIDIWSKHMSHEGVEITGIPLQCRLLAEVYLKHAQMYAKHSIHLTDIEFNETSLVQLYNSYLQIGLDRVKQRITSSDATVSVAEQLLAVEQFHTWQALKLLYPKLAEPYAQYYNVETDLGKTKLDTIMCMGFLLPDTSMANSSVKFVHRTFAEFLTSRFFACIVDKEVSHPEESAKQFDMLVLEHFFQQVAKHNQVEERHLANIRPDEYIYFRCVSQFSTYVVMKFVNDELSGHFNNLVPMAFSNVVTAENCYGMITSTLFQKLPVILGVVGYALAGLSGVKMWWCGYLRYLFGFDTTCPKVSRHVVLLYISARLSNAAVARELYEILSQILNVDLISLHNDRNNDKLSPLHMAVERGEYQIVEHILQYTTLFDEVKIIEYMVKDSYRDPMHTVQSKITLCELLSGGKTHVVPNLRVSMIEPYGNNENFSGAHIDILKFLLQNGMHAGINERISFINSAALWWKFDDLYNLFVLFTTDEKYQKLPNQIHFPLFTVLKLEAISLDAIKLASGNPNIQWDAVDGEGNTLIHAAIVGHQSIDVITQIIKNGANVNTKGTFGWNSLHAAAAQRNIELVIYLLDIDVSLNTESLFGNTPLHLFFLSAPAAEKLFSDVNMDFQTKQQKMKEHFGSKRHKVSATLMHKLVTKIITYQQNRKGLRLNSEKNEQGQTILHNFLYNDEGDLEMSCDLLKMMLNGLQIKVSDTDNAGNSLLDAAIKSRRNEFILNLLRTKLACENCPFKVYLKNACPWLL